MTNYEKIKNISIEEINETCDSVAFCSQCKYYDFNYDLCIKNVKQWLESEVDEQ